MATAKLTKCTIRAGVWHGRVVREDGADGPPPMLSAWHLEAELQGLDLSPVKGETGLWEVSLPVPTEILSDGVQTVLIKDDVTSETLESFTLVTGEPLERDIRAEIDLLRAELDMLKRAFRRHCVETS